MEKYVCYVQYCVFSIPVAGALSTGKAVGLEQPGIQQEPHTHGGLLLHQDLTSPVPVSTGKNCVYIC